MSGFSADWLRLREPADHAARSGAVRDVVMKYLNQTNGANIADLACGTGSTVRALAGPIEVGQEWHLIDSDEALLEQAEDQISALASTLQRNDFGFRTHRLDLKRFPSGLTAINPNLITLSAFVDLVSVDWLSRLVTYALMERIPVYTALTYSGSVTISPEDPSDARIVDACNRHQLNDKGFGPALGPAGADRITKLFKVARFHTIERSSNWDIGPDQAELQNALLKGWAQAVHETRLVADDETDSWLQRRLHRIKNGVSQMTPRENVIRTSQRGRIHGLVDLIH